MKSYTVRMTHDLVSKIKSRSKEGEKSVEQVLRRLLQMPPIGTRRSVFDQLDKDQQKA